MLVACVFFFFLTYLTVNEKCIVVSIAMGYSTSTPPCGNAMVVFGVSKRETDREREPEAGTERAKERKKYRKKYRQKRVRQSG